MIITRLDGGLGNQMFQYAIGRCLAEKLCTVVKMDVIELEALKQRPYNLYCYYIQEHIASQSEIYDIFGEELNTDERINNHSLPLGKVIRAPIEDAGKFNPEILDQTGNLYLIGYWQTENYFIDIKPILQREFIIKYPRDERNEQYARMIRSCNSISLHVRRGDYIYNPHTNYYHGTCDLTYYDRCIDYIARKVKKPHFFIFSDDSTWVKDNLKVKYSATIVDHNGNLQNYEDIFLMSQCKHNIIANSSFSWWGAWLNQNTEKIVCAPKRWFNNAPVDTSDLIPRGWIKF